MGAKKMVFYKCPIFLYKGSAHMKIGFGSDHLGVALKHILMEHVRNKGYECVDYGTADSKIFVVMMIISTCAKDRNWPPMKNKIFVIK